MNSQGDIGLIGLAVMGQNLVLNMNDHGKQKEREGNRKETHLSKKHGKTESGPIQFR